jgi:tryptophan synthase alpha chain
MNPIEGRLRAAAAAGDLALVVFLVLGYPDPATSLQALEILRRQGIAVFELALPSPHGWSPLASGPIIDAHQRAWAAGMRPQEAAAIGAAYRPNLHILYRGTWDDLGLEALTMLRGACDGILPEWRGPSAETCQQEARNLGLAGVEALAPALDPSELRGRVERAQGMVYLTTAESTGGRLFDLPAIAAALGHIKGCRDIPACCGFGVRTPEDVVRLGGLFGCDGVIVGTAALEALGAGLDRFERYIASLAQAARGLKRPGRVPVTMSDGA